MSNPGLITLIRKKIDGGKLLKIEDNIGEAIHLHYGDFRLDFSISDFMKTSNSIVEYADSLNTIPGFRKELFNPEFLVSLSDRLSEIEKIEIDKVKLSALNCYIENKLVLKSIRINHNRFKNKSYKFQDNPFFNEKIVYSKLRYTDDVIRTTQNKNKDNNNFIILFNNYNLIQYGVEMLPNLIKEGVTTVDVVRIFSSHKDFNSNKKYYINPCIILNIKKEMRTYIILFTKYTGLYTPIKFIWRKLHRG